MNASKPSSEYVGLKIMAKFFMRQAQNLSRVAQRINTMLYWEQFGRREDDIHLVTYPKSGTTMTQVILYQLCTNGEGSMDFHHIYDVSPWVDNDVARRHPVRRNLPSPRIIKSHETYSAFEKGTKGRFIYVYRNGMDVAVSLFHQNRNYNNPDLTLERAFEQFMKTSRRSWFRHVRDWFANSKHFPILYLRYEDLIANKREQIEKTVEFLQLDVSPKAIENAMKYSSFDYMKSHEEKFGVQPPDFSKKVFDQFIRKGTTGEGAQSLTEEQKTRFVTEQNATLGRYRKRFE